MTRAVISTFGKLSDGANLAAAAMKRIREAINRSAGQHKRAIARQALSAATQAGDVP